MIGFALDRLDGGAQTRIGQAIHNFFHILLGATFNRVPLGTIHHLQQAMVVAKGNHAGHGKGQHLMRWTTPNGAQHGQQIIVLKPPGKCMMIQKGLHAPLTPSQ